MKPLFALILLFSICPVFADELSLPCKELLNLEKSSVSQLPMEIDEQTQLVKLEVSCEDMSIKHIKHLSVTEAELKKGFEEKMQQKYLGMQCAPQGLANNGYIARDDIFDKDKKLIMQLEAKPKDCKKAGAAG